MVVVVFEFETVDVALGVDRVEKADVVELGEGVFGVGVGVNVSVGVIVGVALSDAR